MPDSIPTPAPACLDRIRAALDVLAAEYNPADPWARCARRSAALDLGTAHRAGRLDERVAEALGELAEAPIFTPARNPGNLSRTS
jgi:hypothetical protein